jgi:hypothetical protein
MNATLKITFVVLVCLAIAPGCAGDTEKISRSGFLTTYPKFIGPGPKGGADWAYTKHDVDFSVYNKLMVDHIAFHFSEDARYKAIHPDDLKVLSEAFHKAIVKALADAYPLVDKPGPDVLRLRLGVTELFPKRPAPKQIPFLSDPEKMKTVTSSGMTIKTSGDLAAGFTYYGEAAMEAELLDSQTNEQLAVAIDRKKTETQKDIISKWEHAEAAFNFWARRLRLFLDKAHGK